MVWDVGERVQIVSDVEMVPPPLGVVSVKRARWAYLLDENVDFRRWYDNLSRGSEGTARERARVLYRFLVKHDMTPEGLVELAKEDLRGIEDILMDFVSELHRDGKSPGYIENYLKAVKSWLKFNGIVIVRSIKIGNMNSTPTIDDERVPTPAELLQIMNYAGERGRCSISLIALAGLRPQVLGDMRGRNGLEIRDLPEIEIEGQVVRFTKVPTRVIVRKEISKNRRQYETFLASEGCECLKAYLEKRLAMGERLEGGSAVIAVKSGHETSGFRVRAGVHDTHITTKAITGEIRKAMRPRFKWRPYVLRAYFATQLLIAENNGKISHAYRQFFMGHKGDMLSRYTTNKGRLPDALIEDMRRAFINSEEYLSTRKARSEEDIMKKQFLLTARMLFPDKVSMIENILARHRVFAEASDEIQELLNLNNREARTVSSEDEMVELVSQGWDLVRELNGGKFLLKRD